MPKSAKPALPQFRTWDEADGAGLEIIRLQGVIETTEAMLAGRIAALKEKYKQAIQESIRDRDLLMDGVEQFVRAHEDELVGRSRRLTHVTVGFRKRPPAVVKVLETWEAVRDHLLSLGARAKAFLAVKTDVDKNALKKAWSEGKLDADALSELGVGIDNMSEDFFCEPIAAQVAAPS